MYYLDVLSITYLKTNGQKVIIPWCTLYYLFEEMYYLDVLSITYLKTNGQKVIIPWCTILMYMKKWWPFVQLSSDK